LGEPIHKVATRGVLLWREFDDKVFSLPREKQAAWLAENRDYVIKRLNADFQKPWFGVDDKGNPTDVGEMTYSQVLRRMVRLLYVAHERRWIDPSLRTLTGDWIRRTEERLSKVNGGGGKKESELQSYSELDNEPEVFLDRFFAKYPTATTQILASEDVKFFINICQRPGQKPVPFIPVLDSSFSIWFKKVGGA
jgi:fatty acid synthase subunit beta